MVLLAIPRASHGEGQKLWLISEYSKLLNPPPLIQEPFHRKRPAKSAEVFSDRKGGKKFPQQPGEQGRRQRRGIAGTGGGKSGFYRRSD